MRAELPAGPLPGGRRGPPEDGAPDPRLGLGKNSGLFLARLLESAHPLESLVALSTSHLSAGTRNWEPPERMAVAQITHALTALEARPLDAEVRVGIHDASRLEWSASVPLPENAPLKYELEAVLEIPSNAFAKHAPWDQLQAFTRLDGPAEPVRAGDALTIDALRRSALGVATRLARVNDGFARDCRLAASLLERTPPRDLEDKLSGWIDSALAIAAEARRDHVPTRSADPVELARERRLVDEYVSVRLLEFLAGIERALAAMLASRAPHAESFPGIVASLEVGIADALETELRYRAKQGYVRADAGSPVALERYLDRASQLKKHFQEVLFLEPEIYQVAERLHHWSAGFAALLASSWAFMAQIFLIGQAPSTTTIGSGLLLLGVLGGLVYVLKDRLKEVGRTWIAGNVHRFYAQRVARYRAPVRRLATRDVIVSARESFDQKTESQPDPLNPQSGARLQSTVIRYVHKGVVSPQPALAREGVRRIKHVFRYDLSPLFARLDDSVKQVPVLDLAPRRVRFVDAPRCYRLPVRLRLVCEGQTTEENVTLVVHKRGLDRLERESELVPLKETGIEPDHEEAPHVSVRPPAVGVD